MRILPHKDSYVIGHSFFGHIRYYNDAHRQWVKDIQGATHFGSLVQANIVRLDIEDNELFYIKIALVFGAALLFAVTGIILL